MSPIAVLVAVATLSSWNDVRRPLTAADAVSVLRGVPDEQRLLTKIQRNYDSRVRPVYNSTHHVTVKFALTLVQIIDVVSTYRFNLLLLSSVRTQFTVQPYAEE